MDPMPQPQPRGGRVPYKFAKIILVACLAGLALFLQVTIWTLEVYIEEKHALRQSVKDASADTNNDNQEHLSETARELIQFEKEKRTVKYSIPASTETLHVNRRFKADTGSSYATAAEAYWKQAKLILDWDAVVTDKEPTDSSSFMDVNVTEAVASMQRAADLGHPEAQYYTANAISAGFWPVLQQPSGNSSSDTMLLVQDTWDPTDQSQTAQAYLYWHMAAVAGHTEAAMTLAARLDVDASKENCWERVLYYRAAADAIMDELETSQQRAKVAPASDKHILHHVHLHGGTGAKLDYYNKPDESTEALQYYHVKAVFGTGDGPSPDAAYTLGKLYHYGLRGVPQNLTLAVEYYEMAALQDDWESAGKAGELYMWGMGVPQDAYAAHRLFRIGMPLGLEGCQNRLQLKLKQSKNDPNPVYTCDDSSLNGMGLLKLLGLPMIVAVDRDEAEELFQLAKDQGSKDAAYNLAMMKLGWKTHFQKVSDLQDDGQTPVNELYGSEHSAPTRAEYQSVLTDLTTAASKGHLQAKHRLAMMYTEGVKIPAKKGMAQIVKDGLVQVVPRDCVKALKHFKSIVETASPQRSQRMRKAYKQYVAGDTANSLRNYLAAAETGSDLAQTNAAFLMERGECLGLSRIDCAKASVRLWKAAASKGSAEASLRVGDFYYYGRFRDDSEPVGPFAWAQYILYPEDFLPKVWKAFRDLVYIRVLKLEAGASELSAAVDDKGGPVCTTGSVEGTCPAPTVKYLSVAKNKLEEDLKMSAHYYRLAADSISPRANFNLGFLYEWGLGLKQDFPLAKRHYDLSVSSSSREADFPVSVALALLNIHELVVKYLHSTSFMPGNNEMTTDAASKSSDGKRSKDPVPSIVARDGGDQIPSSRVPGTTKRDILVSHLLSWESVLILVLTIVLWVLLQHRRTPR